MRRTPFPCAAILLALTSSIFAQPPPRSFMAYVRVIDFDVSRRQGIDACIVVSDDGLFRFEALPGPLQGGGKVYHGRLAPEQLSSLKSLVEDRSLLGLHSSAPRGTMVASESMQTVSLRIHRRAETQELVFMVSDGRGDLPPAARAFIPWMEHFQKTLGKPERHVQARNCTALDATPDFSPQLQKR
jgi:hypothetical protein